MSTAKLKNSPMIQLMIILMLGLSMAGCMKNDSEPQSVTAEDSSEYKVHPIGWVRKNDGRTTIVVNDEYQEALQGVENLSSIWVLYWFDRNDSPEQRSILKVHPFGNPENPLRGVFATRAPVRPNLIALSRCNILSVTGNVIEIDEIDAFSDTPVLDLKP